MPSEDERQVDVASGADVALREPVFGYEKGARGVVVRWVGDTAHVRFEATGHTVPVPKRLLERLG